MTVKLTRLPGPPGSSVPAEQVATTGFDMFDDSEPEASFVEQAIGFDEHDPGNLESALRSYLSVCGAAGIRPLNEIVWSAVDDDRLVLVLSDGRGGATVQEVVGTFPTDYKVLRKESSQNVAEARRLAEEWLHAPQGVDDDNDDVGVVLADILKNLRQHYGESFGR